MFLFSYPRIFHIANSMAPVSEAGMIPILKSLGIFKRSLDMAIVSLIIERAGLLLCDLPTSENTLFFEKVGYFVVGPLENWGFVGFGRDSFELTTWFSTPLSNPSLICVAIISATTT